MIYRFLQRLVRIFVSIFYSVKVEGLENFPASGPVVVCANHTFFKDPIYISCFSPRKIYWMAKIELFRIPLFNLLIRSLGAFPVRRDARDRRSVKNVYKVLGRGAPLGIFPEGRRSLGVEDVPPFKRGFVSFAVNSGASILPVAIRYEGGPFGRGRLFSRAVMSFGQAIPLDCNHRYARDELDGISASVASWIHKKIIC